MDLTKLGSSCLGGPYHKDYSMLGSMLGFHSFSGNTPCFGKVLDLCQIGGLGQFVLGSTLAQVTSVVMAPTG